MPKETDSIVETKIDLDNIPQSFCPNKPIGQKLCPKKVLDGKDTYGQRKYNGHCLFLVKGKKKENIYTRRMENITEYVKDLPVIKDAMSKVKPGQFIMHEMIYFDRRFKKEGFLKCNTLRDGKPQDTLIYGKINPNYLTNLRQKDERL
jgi:hypothetical protein